MANTTRIWSIEGNRQRLDGGSMFGNAPRALWQRWCPPDDEGRIALACRCLLIDEGGRRILCETGIGAFFEPKLRERFGVEESDHVLLESLRKVGVSHEDIDVVVLSHLHFDHAGGLLEAWRPDGEPRLLFPNATFVASASHWERAQSPHPRDRASFISPLGRLLEQSGRLELVAQGQESAALGEGYRLHWSDGHTVGLMLLEIASPEGPIVFAADLIPGVPWVHVPITMGYDRFPEKLIDEKQGLLEDLEARNGRLFFTHDSACALARVARDERGRFTVTERMEYVSALTIR
jgi:glyoxylase-like metal-dependent hydrolase (beta-lactamase superfamily II)